MISAKDIQATCDDIVREFAPLQVILFGSYAYGNPPTEDSDVDMLVVMDILKSETWQQRCEIKARIPKRFHLDLQVRSREDIAYRFSHNDWFLREVLEKGEVLYDTENALPPLRLAEDNTLVPGWEENGILNPLTLEEIRAAEQDWATIQVLQQALTRDVYHSICFHAQQCVEKYLKAWLQEANLRVPRTHELNKLLALIVPMHPEWRKWHTDFDTFGPYAVDIRYGKHFATAAEVENAVRVCTEVRRELRAVLQLLNNENDA